MGTLPVLIDKDLPLRLLTHTLHTSLVWLMAAVIGVHIAAVIKHQLIDHDGLLARMLPFKS
jgi:cytochrome b561